VTAVGYALAGGTATEPVGHASRVEEAEFTFALPALQPDTLPVAG
jgi:hypothetical protein